MAEQTLELHCAGVGWFPMVVASMVERMALLSTVQAIETVVPTATLLAGEIESCGTGGDPMNGMITLCASMQPAEVVILQTTIEVPGVAVNRTLVVPCPLTIVPFVTLQSMLAAPGLLKSVAVAVCPVQYGPLV